ncbi:MAG: methylmalonyl-CoA mutase family protein [Hyphomonadaceae bacterium]
MARPGRQGHEGRPFDRLVSRTEHGLEVRPLYRATDWATAQGDPNLPGAAPWLRGFEAGRDVYLPWDIRQVVSHPNVGAAHDQIIEALEGGVSSIELRLDPAGQSGVAVQTAADVAALLKDVKLDLAPVALDAGETAGAAAAALLAAAIPEDARAAARIDFNIDVASTASDALGAASASIARTFPAARAARADARPVHEAGGTEVQELAVLAGLTAKAMRAMISAGLSPDEAAKALLLTVATGPDILVEMAKLRAARRITGRIAEAFGADAALLRLQAVTSRRMLAARDAWVNLLRNTSACFSAGVGGADVVTVRNFTDAMGEPGKLARRMARNTQIMAQEESSLGRVIDPAGGVWSIEALADEIATAAWKRFQVMETAGGVDAGPTADALKSEIAASADARRKAVRRRKEWITGVNDFPLLGETAPDVDPVERPGEPPKTTGASIAADWDALVAAAGSGATLADLQQAISKTVAPLGLAPMRVAEPFEELAARAAKAVDGGASLKVLLCVLGPLSEHTARLTYAQNFFAVGGLAFEVAEGAPETVAEALASSGAAIACICGGDARYAEEAPATAGALKAAGARRVYLAGRPGDHEAAWRAAGVDEFIHVGVDVVESLEKAHETSGVA